MSEEQQYAEKPDIQPSIDGDIIRVSRTANATSVASVLARAIVSGNRKVKLRGIGAGPINQAAKACAISTQFLAPRGIYVQWLIAWEDVEGRDGNPISALSFIPVVQ